MKLRCTRHGSHALTSMELLVVIAVIVVIMLLLPLIGARHHYSNRLSCVNNLKQINLAYRVWSGDNNDKYPMDVSVTNGGAMELAATGNVLNVFLLMSNELATPKVLYCPSDEEHACATQFDATFSVSNISYFVGIDATEYNPQMILSGDDHLQLNGIPVKSGLSTFATNSDLGWTSSRHVPVKEHFWMPAPNEHNGNIGLADGSAQQLTSAGLQHALQQTGTNFTRLAIP
jgi:hypothetical protein